MCSKSFGEPVMWSLAPLSISRVEKEEAKCGAESAVPEAKKA